jgi:hypothetical protein
MEPLHELSGSKDRNEVARISEPESELNGYALFFV